MMMNEPLTFTALRGTLARDVPLARYTSWRCGGPGERVYIPADREDLGVFLRRLPHDEPVTAIGLGSNLLVRDGGIRGTIVVLHAALNTLEMRDGLIYAEAGVASPKVARFAAKHGFAGAEFLAGIPGTVGGALAMNAGCYGSETWQFVSRVTTIDRSGELRSRGPAEFELGYRHVELREARLGEAEWFVEAEFAFPPAHGENARERIKQLLARRIASQPLGLPNAGSVFRNPPGDHAARLIEASGLKGCVIGGAAISEKHANFIVNPGGRASAADIEQLIAHAARTVYERFGIRLAAEVRIIGEAKEDSR